MDHSRESTPVPLAKGRSITLTDATSTIIRCQQGSLWVTQNNDVRDIVIGPGEQFRPDRNGPVVVYALVASRVSWTPIKVEAVTPWKTFSARLLQRLVSSVASRHPAIE